MVSFIKEGALGCSRHFWASQSMWDWMKWLLRCFPWKFDTMSTRIAVHITLKYLFMIILSWQVNSETYVAKFNFGEGLDCGISTTLTLVVGQGLEFWQCLLLVMPWEPQPHP